jgi:hypothetical protein
MDFELVVVQGRSATSTIKLNDGVTTIGRHDDCQLRIKSSQVSRKHCELFEKKGILLVKDLKSSNGTIVNGKKIEGQRVLEVGDELTIGPIQLRVAKVGTGQAPLPSKAAPGPGDTAVTAAAAAAEDQPSDEFTLEYDATVQGNDEATVVPTVSKPAPKKKASKTEEDDFADFLIDLPMDDEDEEQVEDTSSTQPVAVAASTPPAEAVKSGPPPAARKEEEKHQEKEPAVSDDAIADFLLDIKIDDEE